MSKGDRAEGVLDSLATEKRELERQLQDQRTESAKTVATLSERLATLEDEFLAYTVLPSQQTVGEWVNPQVDEVYETGVMPPMLPGLPVESALRALPGAR